MKTKGRIMSVHFSSKSNEWGTPDDLFNELNALYNFKLDPCATPQNTKCPIYFTKEDDGLVQDWALVGNAFVNPPYGRNIKKWVKKGLDESLKGIIVVMLIPARTDTSYWHDYIFQYAQIKFLRGRLYFINEDRKLNGRAPFPSAIIIFGNNDNWAKNLKRDEISQVEE